MDFVFFFVDTFLILFLNEEYSNPFISISKIGFEE